MVFDQATPTQCAYLEKICSYYSLLVIVSWFNIYFNIVPRRSLRSHDLLKAVANSKCNSVKIKRLCYVHQLLCHSNFVPG